MCRSNRARKCSFSCAPLAVSLLSSHSYAIIRADDLMYGSPVCLPVCLVEFVYLFFHTIVSLSVGMSVCLRVCLFACLFVCLFVCLFLFVCVACALAILCVSGFEFQVFNVHSRLLFVVVIVLSLILYLVQLCIYSFQIPDSRHHFVQSLMRLVGIRESGQQRSFAASQKISAAAMALFTA